MCNQCLAGATPVQHKFLGNIALIRAQKDGGDMIAGQLALVVANDPFFALPNMKYVAWTDGHQDAMDCAEEEGDDTDDLDEIWRKHEQCAKVLAIALDAISFDDALTLTQGMVAADYDRSTSGVASYWLVNQIAEAVKKSIEPTEIIAELVALIRTAIGSNLSYEQRSLLERAGTYLASFGI